MIPQKLIDHIQTEDAQNFIKKYSGGNLTFMLFKFSKEPFKKALISQLIQRKKMAGKLPQWTSCPYILLPLSFNSEQSSSEATAKLKSQLLGGEKLMDLNGGMGVDSYYLSLSFNQVIYIEQDSELAQIAAHNFKMLGASNIKVIHGDGLEELKNTEAGFIYADPGRRDENKSKVHQLQDYEPNLIPHIPQLIKDGRSCLIKTSPMLDISQAVEQLQFVKEVWVISHKNDCKEVCFLLNAKTEENYLIKTFNIHKETIEKFEFYSNHNSSAQIAENIGDFLYEPNASLQKSNGVNILAMTYELEKLHSNTNILSGGLKENFPGKRFKVLKILKPYDRSLRKKRLNVISRNYPDNASVIEKKLKLKGSKNEFLIAVRIGDGSYKFIHAILQ